MKKRKKKKKEKKRKETYKVFQRTMSIDHKHKLLWKEIENLLKVELEENMYPLLPSMMMN